MNSITDIINRESLEKTLEVIFPPFSKIEAERLVLSETFFAESALQKNLGG